MIDQQNYENEQEIRLSGICGLYCASCTSYIGTKSDPNRLKLLATRSNKSIEDFICEGCRSNKLSSYCRNCTIKKCAIEKGINYCVECDEYPCEEIVNFQKQLPHRIELFESLEYLKLNGFSKWNIKMKEDYTCSACGEINSAYDFKCRRCENIPGNAFVKRNGEAIKKELFKR